MCYGDNVTITYESDGGIILWVFNTDTIRHIINTTETIPSINATIVTIREADSTPEYTYLATGAAGFGN